MFLSEVWKIIVTLTVIFLATVFMNCVFLETLKANARKPSPNVFQFEKGYECFCKQLEGYYLLLEI